MRRSPFIKIYVVLLIMVAGAPCSVFGQADEQAMPADASVLDRWDLEKLSEPPKYRWLDDQSPIRSLLLEGEQYNGQPTEIFAYFSSPARLKGESKVESDLPAIVLLHGGGGTAFCEWVQMWVDRGYAAIALDLGGKRPKAPEFNADSGRIERHYDFQREFRVRLENGGPLDDVNNKILNVDGDLTNDWQFHAVSAAIRAHSFLRSLPEVDPQKTAVTGISWGGYLTCLTASVDHRFKAAVPVYGCGYLYDGQSVQRALIERNSEEQQKAWIQHHDPSRFLPHCKVPILFVNGTNDKHYPLWSYLRSYRLVKGEKAIRIEAGMQHSHQAGWTPVEIQRFIDHKLLQKPGLCQVTKNEVVDGVLKVEVGEGTEAVSATLQYTEDKGPFVDRKWKSVFAQVEGAHISVAIPAKAKVWCLAIKDKSGAMISTEIRFLNGKPCT